ncbi:hypothetical protein HDU82_002826, partial [Entophlyctis luteolus]
MSDLLSGEAEAAPQVRALPVGADGSPLDAERMVEASRIFDAHRAKRVAPFLQNKLINEAPKNWDLFYKRNGVNFFKDRHWTWREFPELVRQSEDANAAGSAARLLEVGCGVGNFVFPLLGELCLYEPVFVHCVLSNTYPTQNKTTGYLFMLATFPLGRHFLRRRNALIIGKLRAVNFVKENELYDESRVCAFVCDLTVNPLTDNIPPASLDFVTAIFCLSAIPPSKLEQAVRNIASVLKAGGVVLLRDYAVYDEAELRFKPGHMMDDHFYMRQDGTFSVYFSLEQLRRLFEGAGLAWADGGYVTKAVENRLRE